MRLSEEQHQLRQQIEIVAFYGIHAVEYFNGVTNRGGDFWKFTQNCYGERAVHLWCQLFNSYNKEPTHYKNLFGDDALAPLDPELSFSKVRDRLIASSGLSEVKYMLFRKSVIDFRNKYSAHRQFDMGSINFPELDHALLMLHEIRQILRESVESELGDEDDVDLEFYLRYYEENTKEDLERKCRNDIERIQFFE